MNSVYIDKIEDALKLRRLGTTKGEQVISIDGKLTYDIISPTDIILLVSTIIGAINNGNYTQEKLEKFLALSYKYAGLTEFNSVICISYSKPDALSIKWVKELKAHKKGVYFYFDINPLDLVKFLFFGVLANTHFERVQNYGVSTRVNLYLKDYVVMPKRDCEGVSLLLTEGEKQILEATLGNIHGFSRLNYSYACCELFSTHSDIYNKKEI